MSTDRTDPLLCPSRVSVLVSTTPEHQVFRGGGAEIEWRVQERGPDPAGGCRDVGPQRQGSSSVEGPCCESVIDVEFSTGRIFRIAVRTDWQ